MAITSMITPATRLLSLGKAVNTMSVMGLKARLAGTVALEEGGEGAVDDLLDFTITWQKPAADAAAGDLTADLVVWVNPFSFPVKVMAGRYTANSGALVANDTNNVTINIKTDDGLPAGPAPVTALSYQNTVANGGLLVNDSKAFPVWTPGNAVVPPGGGVWVGVAKAGTGVILPSGVITLRLRKTGPG